MPAALITGATAGLGLALADELARRGWALVIDGRRPERLEEAVRRLGEHTTVTAIHGDVAGSGHREELVAAVAARGPLDLLVNNASDLGDSPQPSLAELDEATFARIWAVNVAAPLHLTRGLLSHLNPGAAVINISSDAAAEHYEGWGGYAASKAALDHLTQTFAAELPTLRWYAVDPGDMRTEMHQAAFPGEDISDRPEADTVAPVLAGLATSDVPSGRHRAADLTRLATPAVPTGAPS